IKRPIGHRQPAELIFLPADNLESKRWANLTETSSAGRLAPGLRPLFSCTTSSIAIISMCSGFECRPELGRKCFAKLEPIFQTCKFLTFFFLLRPPCGIASVSLRDRRDRCRLVCFSKASAKVDTFSTTTKFLQHFFHEKS
ncbi:hypothetical protein, partial [Paramuribaculum intestinale]|uniref:hypothetical protein n=4 Tax=Paramuribaculum intestinale TaxID=2094151 RepID=UPI0025B6AB1D